MTQPTFGLVGAAGFVAPKHIDAIHAVGGRLVWACDPHDAVGVLDRYGWDVEFHRGTCAPGTATTVRDLTRADYWVVATPNDDHATDAIVAMRSGADAIVEKPVVLGVQGLEVLRWGERATGRRVHPVLQLRLHPAIRAWRERIRGDGHHVEVRYVAPRGPWYDQSWKGDPTRSGGVETNIGVHIFDALLWLFGEARSAVVTDRTARMAAGLLDLDRARVGWMVSTDPADVRPGRPNREMTIDGETVGLDDVGSLHAAVYREILAGRWYGLDDAAPAVALCERLRGAALRSEAA